MSAVINIAELRSEISKIVTSDPKKFSWALNLPETTLDAYALEMLSKNAESPMGLLEKLNPFAIQEQLSAVTRLFGVIAQIRAECFTLEAQLYSEIYAESLAEDSAAAAMKLQQLATSADWVILSTFH